MHHPCSALLAAWQVKEFDRKKSKAQMALNERRHEDAITLFIEALNVSETLPPSLSPPSPRLSD